MEASTITKPKTVSFSLQAEIIRQIQINDGQTPCYGTSASKQCDKKECSWRYDCFEEVCDGRLDPPYQGG